jgi:hypothetical protein
MKMTTRSVVRHDSSVSREGHRKWLGTHRGTHWSVAGLVAVIIFGSYFIYNIHSSNLAATIAIPGAERVPAIYGPLARK